MSRRQSLVTDMPDDCSLIQAKCIKVGDVVRFRASFADYTVEDVETDAIGHIKHTTEDGARTCSYHPGELLWITRRGAS